MKTHTLIALIWFSLLTPSLYGQQTNVTLSPAAIEAINKGIMAAKLPDYPLAVRCFEEARKASPQSPEIFYYLGLAESKIAGRELRAICWLGAYLAANPAATTAPALKDEINVLYRQNQSNLSRLVQTAQKTMFVVQFRNPWLKILAETEITKDEATAGDIAGAQKAFAMEIKAADSIENAFGKSFAIQCVADAEAEVALNQTETGDPINAQKNFAEALKTADLINHDDDKSWTRARIVKNQVNAGYIDDAVKTAGLIKDAAPQTYAQAMVAKAQLYKGDIAGAQKSASLIQETNDNKSDIENGIAEAQARTGNISDALKTTGLIQSAYYKGSAQLSIARAQIKGDDIPGAMESLASAQKNTDLIQDAADKDKIKIPLDETQTKVNNVISFQKDMDKFGKMEIQLKRNDIVGALKNADLFENLGYKMEALSFISETQAKNGDYEGAKKTVDLVPYESWKDNLLNGVAMALEMGKEKGADEKFNAYLISQKSLLEKQIAGHYLDAGDVTGAKRLAEFIENAGDKIDELCYIAEAQATAGEITDVQKTFAYAKKIAVLIPDTAGRSSILEGIVYHEAEEREIGGAQNTADLITDPYYKSSAQVYIAKAQAKSGDMNGAQKTFADSQRTVDLIQDSNLKGQAQDNITKALTDATNASQTIIQPLTIHSDWLQKLDDDEKDNYCPLNTQLFLDFAGYMRTQNSNDPETLFNALKDTAEKIVKAQNTIGRMLKQQAPL